MREVMMKAQELAQAILETGYYQKMQELEAQLTMRNYKGFLN